MFNKNTNRNDEVESLEEKLAIEKRTVDSLKEKISQLNDYEKELKLNHKLELKEKEFEIKHYKDEEMAEKDKENETLRNENAVLKKENEMLDKVIDINKDVIDVKELVTTLIKKLPEINISNLTLNSKNDEK